MHLKDVLISIIIEANPTIPKDRLEELVKKYRKVTAWADED